MSDKDNRGPFHPDEINLSQLSIEQLKELKNAILTRARDRIGPEGFNPIMQDSTDGDLFGNTEDWVTDPRDWVILVARIFYSLINVASRRVSLAIAASGAAFTGTQLLGTNGAAYGRPALLVAAALGVWLVVDLAMPAPTRASR